MGLRVRYWKPDGKPYRVVTETDIARKKKVTAQRKTTKVEEPRAPVVRPLTETCGLPLRPGETTIVIPCSGEKYEKLAAHALASAKQVMPDVSSAILHYDQEGDTRWLRERIPGVCPGKAVSVIQDVMDATEVSNCGTLIVSADSLVRNSLSLDFGEKTILYAANASTHDSEITRPWCTIADALGFREPHKVWADPVNVWSRIATRPYWDLWADMIREEQRKRGVEATSHHMVFGTVLYRYFYQRGQARSLQDQVHLHVGHP